MPKFVEIESTCMGTRAYLSHAIIELTPDCNLRCRHCYNWWKREGQNSRKGITFTYRKAFTLLDWLVRSTTVEQVVFTGGEPTLVPRFLELVLHARLAGLKVGIITNGNGPRGVYEELGRLKVNLVEISLHDTRPEVHDGITGVEGSWWRTMDTLRLVMDAGLKVVPVIVVTVLNADSVVDTVRYLYGLGVRRFMVNRYNIGGEGLNQAISLVPSRDVLRRVFRELDKVAGELSLDVFSGVCTPHCLLDPRDFTHVRFGNCSPDVYRRPLTFDLDGNLRLCNHSPAVVGNVFRDDFPAMLFSPYACSWDNLTATFCRDCLRWEKCRGGCRAASEQTGGMLKDVDPVVTELKLEPFKQYR